MTSEEESAVARDFLDIITELEVARRNFVQCGQRLLQLTERLPSDPRAGQIVGDTIQYVKALQSAKFDLIEMYSSIGGVL